MKSKYGFEPRDIIEVIAYAGITTSEGYLKPYALCRLIKIVSINPADNLIEKHKNAAIWQVQEINDTKRIFNNLSEGYFKLYNRDKRKSHFPDWF